MSDLLHRRADAAAHGLLLRNLLPAYEAMEDGLRRSQDTPLLRAFAAPALHRSATIRNDLARLSAGWADEMPLLAAGDAYGRHVAALAQNDDRRIAAHAYVRYFGDLSGGQILKPFLMQTLGLPAEALTFYDFPGLGAETAKDAMRAQLDGDAAAMGVTPDLVEEAAVAFEHNIAVSEAVRAAV